MPIIVSISRPESCKFVLLWGESSRARTKPDKGALYERIVYFLRGEGLEHNSLMLAPNENPSIILPSVVSQRVLEDQAGIHEALDPDLGHAIGRDRACVTCFTEPPYHMCWTDCQIDIFLVVYVIMYTVKLCTD